MHEQNQRNCRGHKWVADNETAIIRLRYSKFIADMICKEKWTRMVVVLLGVASVLGVRLC